MLMYGCIYVKLSGTLLFSLSDIVRMSLTVDKNTDTALLASSDTSCQPNIKNVKLPDNSSRQLFHFHVNYRAKKLGFRCKTSC